MGECFQLIDSSSVTSLYGTTEGRETGVDTVKPQSMQSSLCGLKCYVILMRARLIYCAYSQQLWCDCALPMGLPSLFWPQPHLALISATSNSGLGYGLPPVR